MARDGMLRPWLRGDAFLYRYDSDTTGRSPRSRIARQNWSIGERRADLGQEDTEFGLEDIDTEFLGVAAEDGRRPLNGLRACDGGRPGIRDPAG